MIIIQSIHVIGIIAALTIVGTTIAGFGFILATAQTMTDNATRGGGNMTSGGNTTGTDQTNQAGNISGSHRLF